MKNGIEETLLNFDLFFNKFDCVRKYLTIIITFRYQNLLIRKSLYHTTMFIRASEFKKWV